MAGGLDVRCRDMMSAPMLKSSPSPRLQVNEGNGTRAFLVVSVPADCEPGTAAAEAYAQIGDALRGGRMEIVHERIFGSAGVETAVKAARREALQSQGIRSDGAVTYIDGRPTWGEGLAGVLIHAVSAGDDAGSVRTVLDSGVPCGRTWRTGGTSFILLQNIQGLLREPGGDNAPGSQASRTMERADRILREQGAGYRNTVRTWFYLSDILGWYAEFNQARTARYGEFGLIPRPGEERRMLPASTGIRADSPGGAACSMDLLAVVPDPDGGPVVEFVKNPRQQEAFRYGSAFSRSAAIRGARETLIEVSGTAAIDENGRSLYPGDMRGQVRCTLDRMASLLEQSQASLQDIGAATVFVKRAGDAEAAREVMADLGLERFPAVWVVADVCRDDLLFEIDAEAVVPRSD